MHYVIAAIMYLMPQQNHSLVKKYADLITFEARWYKQDPLLLIAIIRVESNWNTRKKSKTNDYGLAQIHVARRGSSNFYGREKELYDPRTNIREGARILAMWNRYHDRTCDKDVHDFWAHYKFGYKVKNTLWANKVNIIYRTLIKKFRPPLLPLLSLKGAG